jgi:D-glycero-alpha-D-manno-heptose-7-phosphate kinase
MIISRTPFRISFFGGGTDYPAWYKEHGGAVLSSSINKYCYISCRHLPPFFKYRYLIRYRLREEVARLSEIQHASVRECLRFLGFEHGIEMVHTSDLPGQSGIGSSSAFTVGFLKAMYALEGRMVGKRRLASEAILIEQKVIGENVGSQDQVAAAFGGLNRIEFNAQEDFMVQPVTIGQRRITELQNHLMLFFTGFSRTASEIAAEQIKNTASKATELETMHQMVDEATRVLSSDGSLDDFGRLLHESWQLKRTLSSRITTGAIDDMYEAAVRAGAMGGKLCGAGGGGFLLLFVPPRKRRLVQRALNGLLYVPFEFESLGSQITYYADEGPYYEHRTSSAVIEVAASRSQPVEQPVGSAL